MAVGTLRSLPTLFSLLFLTFCVLANAEKVMFETVSVGAHLPSSGRSIPKAKARGDKVVEVVHRKTSSPKNIRSHAFAKNSLQVATLQKRRHDEPSIPGHDASVYPIAGLDIGISHYVITFEFGEPYLTQTVIMDTSSDIGWIRCQNSMEMFYPQDRMIIYPKTSSTYRNFSCDSTICMKMPSTTCFNDTTCYYRVGYGENIYSFGFLGSDTLRLPSGERFDDFTFGCGQNIEGFSFDYSGLIGMGRGAFSLNSQLSPRIANIFSYCLPSEDLATGFLQFGNPPTTQTEYTPMVTDSRAPSLYSLNLTGIKVGGKKLDLSSSVFQSAGTIIDSGTEISRLPPEAYNALKTAFRANMTKYPVAAAADIFDTCYDFSKVGQATYPAIWFHFDGLDLKVPSSGVFYSFSSAQYCLAFAGNSNAGDVGIIGTHQQRTMEITHDNINSRIGFGRQACE